MIPIELASPHLLLALAVLLGFAVQTALGFGGGLISMSLAALWMPIPEIVPLVVPLSIVQSIAVLLGERQHVAWRPLLRLMIPTMAVGLALGLWLAAALVEHDAALRRVYGTLVVALALPGLWPQSSLDVPGGSPDRSPDPSLAVPRPLRAAVASWVAGVVHGLFATGGPPLAYAAQCLRLQRDAFRTTLLTAFLGTNVVMVLLLSTQDRLRVEHAPALTLLAGAVLIAVPLGRWLARRLPEQGFRRAVYGMLLLTGLSLLG